MMALHRIAHTGTAQQQKHGFRESADIIYRQLSATLTDHRADINRLTSDRTKPDNNLTDPKADTFVFLFSHRTKKIKTVYGSRTLLKINSNVSNFADPH
jgi:hypothetical protein